MSEAVIVHRRRRAAELWQSVNPSLFDMRKWSLMSADGSCAYCALGWLAKRRYDEWDFFQGMPRCLLLRDAKIHPRLRGYGEAATYFGIDIETALLLFSCHPETRRFYRRWFVRRITGNDVATALLNLPPYKSV